MNDMADVTPAETVRYTIRIRGQRMEPAKHIINRFVEELWNARRLDVADQIFSEDCVTHQLRSGILAAPAHRGPQEMKEHVSGWLRSFPDLRFNIEQMITEQDRVMSQL